MTPLEALKIGRDRVARGWTQMRSAINQEGKSAFPWTDDAVSWCAMGALAQPPESDMTKLFPDPAAAARDWLIEAMHLDPTERARTGQYSAVAQWNDTPGRTQAEVVALYDEAIRLAEADAE